MHVRDVFPRRDDGVDILAHKRLVLDDGQGRAGSHQESSGGEGSHCLRLLLVSFLTGGSVCRRRDKVGARQSARQTEIKRLTKPPTGVRGPSIEREMCYHISTYIVSLAREQGEISSPRQYRLISQTTVLRL